jgi:hypothetical protein
MRCRRQWHSSQLDANSMDIAQLPQTLKQFAAERYWEQFHTPKILAMALII